MLLLAVLALAGCTKTVYVPTYGAPVNRTTTTTTLPDCRFTPIGDCKVDSLSR